MKSTSNHSQQGLLRKDSYAVLEVLSLTLKNVLKAILLTPRYNALDGMTGRV